MLVLAAMGHPEHEGRSSVIEHSKSQALFQQKLN
jgi:hypothetical protein